MKRNAEQLLATAYHEAGHAVVAVYLGRGVRYATIAPKGDSAGHISRYRQSSFERLELGTSSHFTKRVQEEIVIYLAGSEAQRKSSPRSIRSYHADSDYRSAIDFAFRLCGSSQETTAFIKWLRIRTRDILKTSFVWHGVKVLAGELMKRQTIQGQELKRIVLEAFKEHVKIKAKRKRRPESTPRQCDRLSNTTAPAPFR